MVRLHNDGPALTSGQATVTLGYRPCCAGWYQNLASIATVPVPAMATGSTAIVSAPWHLPGSFNGGPAWGGHINAYYNHFCVQAIINVGGNTATPLQAQPYFPTPGTGTWGWPFPGTSAGGPNPPNTSGPPYPSWWTAKSSWVQENFDNVSGGHYPKILEKGYRDPFSLENPFAKAVTARFVARLPKGVTVSIKGLPKNAKFGTTFQMPKGYAAAPILPYGRPGVPQSQPSQSRVWRHRRHHQRTRGGRGDL